MNIVGSRVNLLLGKVYWSFRSQARFFVLTGCLTASGRHSLSFELGSVQVPAIRCTLVTLIFQMNTEALGYRLHFFLFQPHRIGAFLHIPSNVLRN